MSPSRSRLVYRILLLVLLAGVAGSRLHTREQYISGIDPGNYLIGMQDYSIAAERPHPPGYPVYIAICRAVSDARSMSFWAPVEMSSHAISSAARPPSITQMRSRSSARVMR